MTLVLRFPKTNKNQTLSKSQPAQTLCRLLTLLLIGLILPAEGFAQDEKAELSIAQTAANAQNTGDFKFAATEWERLIKRFPGSARTPKAHFNAGVCHMYSSEYPKAIEHFKAALPGLDPKSVQKPESSLFLGFCQYRHGQNLKAKGDEQSNVFLTTATQSLAALIKDEPTFEDLDQACYYQGEAFNELGRLEDALKSYQRMLKCPKQSFKLEGLYAIADTHDQLGQFTDALKYYEQFDKEAKAAGGSPWSNEVKMRTGSTLMELAKADEAAGKQNASNKKLNRASKLLSEVIDADVKDDPKHEQIVEESRFELAFCSRRLGEYEKAAKLYEELGANPDSRYAEESIANAGRNYLDAGQLDKAETMIRKTIDSGSKFADIATHWLALAYLVDEKNPTKAYDIAKAQLDKPSENERVPLRMVQAEAAYAIPDRLKESADLFKAIAKDNPKHVLAPTALKNAAFAELDLEAYDDTIKTATDFENQFPDSADLAEALELKGEAYLLSDRPAEAVKVLDDLISRFGDHPNAAFWNLRSGLGRYLQKDYTGTVSKLTPIVDRFESASRKAETLFWIGSSEYQLEKYPEAISALQQSFDSDKKWGRADETLLMLCRANLKSDNITGAKKAATDLIDGYPDSESIGALHFYLGDYAFSKDKFEDAMTNFQVIIDDYGKTVQAPLALYKAALAQAKLSKFEESDRLFSKLIDQFPKHELAKEAKVDRGSMRLKSGDAESSIADLTEFLKTNPTGKERYETVYKIGLAQIELKDWDAAIETLEELVDEATESPRLDSYYYDLAWAHKYRKAESASAEDQSVDYFKQIAAMDSKLAGEANFHVGVAAYDNEKFDEAASAFDAAFKSETSDTVKEKAAYKLGWSHYKQEEYDESMTAFLDQVKAYPEGELMADAAFMIGEALFRQKKYEQAYQAYATAKPSVDASTTIQPTVKALTMLHGSQAANKVRKYEEAKQMATELAESDFDESFKQDAWLEVGSACQGLKQEDEAVEAWQKAADNLGKTGARANCMIGDHHFKEKKFDDAINQFKLVYFGFGGPQAGDDVKPWQAYAVYETARCSFVRIGSAPDELKAKYKDEAIKWFEYLIKNYPNDALAPEAKRQLESLKKLN